MRLDIALVERGFATTRSAAQHMVAAGAVLIDGVVADKPSRKVLPGAMVTTDANRTNPWVSRGGLKLEAALEQFCVDVSGREALDVGASTGGFTNVLLERGATFVVALDVGHGQLHPRLAADARVENLEGTNVRHVSAAGLGRSFEIVVVDVSFISLHQIVDALAEVCTGDLLVLVKPQFEVGRKALGKGGVVRNHDLHAEVLADVVAAFADRGLVYQQHVVSPIAGSDGNVEFMTWFVKERP